MSNSDERNGSLSSRYSDAGVDIDAANKAMKGIGKLAKSTWSSRVLSEIGNFGGLYEMPRDFENPVLVSSADGVGTKLKLAFMTGRHDTIGEDLVNHCVNDILVQGAEPLFFLDYFGCGKLDPSVVTEVVRGLATGCKNNGCALIGGETAEMPGFYGDGEYDLAGCIVGIVERDAIIDGRTIAPGDAVLALPSSGLHTNGYSLARKTVFEDAGLDVADEIPGTGRKAADILLEVHRSYLQEVRSIRKAVGVKGLAHITGGGLLENIPRIIPDGCAVRIDKDSWKIPPLFEFLRERGRVNETEMYRVYNMGIGMVVIVPGGEEKRAVGCGCRWEPFRIGEIIEGEKRVHIE